MDTETDGIVLRRFDFSESSQVGHLFTLDGGRVSVLAKGIKKPNASLKGPLDLFQFARVRYRRHSGTDLGILTRFEPVTGFRGLRESLARIYAAFYLAELVHEGMREGDPDEGVFKLLGRGLAALEVATPASVPAIVLAAELGFLRHTGFSVVWDRCAACGGPLAGEGAVFHPRAGGRICDRCPRPAGPRIALAPGSRAILSALDRAGPRHAGRLRITAPQARELRGLMRAVLHEVLERPLKSEPFLSDTRHGYPASRRALGSAR